jgi:hypothetical protein
MSHEIGKANYSSGKKNFFKVKDGSQEYRILPPFAELAKEGRWAVYESVHWGYKDSNGKFKIFRCIQQKKGTMISKECPECSSIAAKTKARDAKKEELQKKGKNANEIKELLTPFNDWLQAHNNQRCWYVNAMNSAGEIGRLEIKHTCYQALMAEIRELLKKGIDPLDPAKGVWFKFTRTGMGRDTKYKVDVAKEVVTVNGDELMRTKFAPLTPDVLERMQSEAWLLKDMFTSLDFDQVKRLVESGGDPSVTDSVFGSGQLGDEAEPTEEELAGSTTTVTANAVANALPKEESPDPEAQELAKFRESRKTGKGMSNDEFMSTFGK